MNCLYRTFCSLPNSSVNFFTLQASTCTFPVLFKYSVNTFLQYLGLWLTIDLLIDLFFFLSFSDPLKDPNLCGQPACEPGKKFNYATGTKYTHKYSVEVSTLFRGTSENRSTLYTDALVHITFLTPCQGLLQVRGHIYFVPVVRILMMPVFT